VLSSLMHCIECQSRHFLHTLISAYKPVLEGNCPHYQNLSSPYTGCVSESGDFKNTMNSKCFHLSSFNTYEHNVYIKEFRFFQFQFNTVNNLTH